MRRRPGRRVLYVDESGSCFPTALDPAAVIDAVASDPGLRPFTSHGRIKTLPARQARRHLLLDKIAQAFEPGVRYSERQVSLFLGALHADYAALRRYLVDEEFRPAPMARGLAQRRYRAPVPPEEARVLADFVCSVQPGAADDVASDRGDHVIEGEAGWQARGLVEVTPSPRPTPPAGYFIVRGQGQAGSSVHQTNTCVSCHTDVAVASRRQPGRRTGQLRRATPGRPQVTAPAFTVSRSRPATNAATCQDCHDSHEILPPIRPPRRFIFRARRRPAARATTRRRATGQRASTARRWRRVRDAPTCTGCHSEHPLRSLKGSSSMTISDVCSHCHASERLNTQYNLPADRVNTFFESYHGLAAQYGSTVAANCASCHGFHKILPSSDTNSTINTNHLVATCGQCHPGANRMFVRAKSTWSPDGRRAGPFGTTEPVGAADLSLPDFRHHRRHVRPQRHSVFEENRGALSRRRAAGGAHEASQRWQHFVLATSFIVLAVTGFALKFPDSWLAKLLGSNEPFRRWTHRVAGIVLLLIGLYHLIYILVTRDGRKLVTDLFPVKKDSPTCGGPCVIYRLEPGKTKNRPLRLC